MFNRIMFIIVLALFALVPFSVVYAEDLSFDLSAYTIYDNTDVFEYAITDQSPYNSYKDTWFSTPAGACSAYFSVYPRSGPYNWLSASPNATGEYCTMRKTNKTPGSPQDGLPADPSNASISKRRIPVCPVDQLKFIDWRVSGNRSTPANSACQNSCEYTHKDVGGLNTAPSAFYDQTTNTTLMTISQAYSTGKSCSLNICPVGETCEEEEPEPEDCPASEKEGNGGQCQTPDPNGNKCPTSEKESNGGQCQTPDPNGNKCPTSEKESNGGQCQTPDGDGNKCTDALKASLGGKCPVQGSGDCTAEQKLANGGTCPTGSGGTCTANPINKKVCEFIDFWTKNDDLPDLQNVPISDQMPSGVDLQEIDSNRVVFAAQCPPDISIPIKVGQGSGSITLPFKPMCDFAIMLRPFIIAMAYLSGAYIVLGLAKD